MSPTVAVSQDPHRLWCGGLFVLHTLGVLLLASTGIQASDSSEFILSAVLGTPHPSPGYPLLSLWDWCFSMAQ